MVLALNKFTKLISRYKNIISKSVCIIIVSSINSILLLLFFFVTHPDNLIYTVYVNFLIFLPWIIVCIIFGCIDTILNGLILFGLGKTFSRIIPLKNTLSIIIKYKSVYTVFIFIINFLLVIIRSRISMKVHSIDLFLLTTFLLMPLIYLFVISSSIYKLFNHKLFKTIIITIVSVIISLIFFIGQIYTYIEFSAYVSKMRIQSFIGKVDIPTEKLFTGKKICTNGDCENGNGIASYTYGFTFIGNFKEGIPNGYGELYRYQMINYRLISKGIWKEGKLIKKE